MDILNSNLKSFIESFDHLLGRLPDAILVHDFASIAYVNQAYRDAFEIGSETDVLGLPVPKEIVCSEHIYGVEAQKESGNNGCTIVEREFERKDGASFWVECHFIDLQLEGVPYQQVLFKDISKVNELERKFSQKSRLLNDAEHLLQIGTWDWDIETNSIVWSDEMYRIFDLNQDSFHPSYDNWIKAIHPDDRKEVKKQLDSLRTRRNDVRFSYRINCSNGEIRYVESWCVLELQSKELPSRYIGTTVDMTELRMHEQAFHNLANNFTLMNGEAFFNNVCHYLTRSLQVDYAFVGELMDSNRIRVIGGVGKGEILGEMEYSLAGTPCANVMDSEVCFYNQGVQELFPDDQLLVEMGITGYVGCPLMDREGNSIGIIVLLNENEISNSQIAASTLQIFSERTSAELQRLESETKLADSENKLTIINNHSPDVIYTIDRDLRITYMNKSFIGVNPQDALGVCLDEVIPAHCFQQFHSYLNKAFSGKKQSFELNMYQKPGKDIWYSIRMSPIDVGTSIQNVLIISTEITARKKSEIRNNVIDAVANKLNSSLSLSDFCEFIFSELQKIKPFHNLYISKYDHQKKELALFFQTEDKKILKDMPPPRVDGNGLSEYIIRTKKGLVLNGKEPKALQKELGLQIYGELAKSWLGVPLMVDDEAIGVLAVQCLYTENVYDDEDFNLFSFIGSQIGTFIEKVRVEKEISQFKKYFSISMDMLCIADTNGTFKKVNPKFTEILGYSDEELYSKPFVEFIHPDDVEATLLELEQLSKGKETLDFINRYRCKNGEYKWFLWASASDVKTNSIYAAAKDVTEQIKTRDILTSLTEIQGAFIAAHSTSDSFELIIKKILELTKSEFGCIVKVDSRTKKVETEVLAFSAVSDSNVKEAESHGIGCQKVKMIMEQVVLQNDYVIADNVQPEIIENQNHEGQKEVGNILAMPFYNGKEMIGLVVAGNSPKGYADKDVQQLSPFLSTCSTLLISLEDKKKKLEAEEKLSNLAGIVYNSSDAIISTDFEGIVLSWNSGAEKMYEYSAEEMLGVSVAKLGPKSLRKAHYKIMQKVLKGYSVESYETVQLKKGNRLMHVNMSIFPLLNEKGEVKGVSSILRDISEQKEIQKMKEAFTRELEMKVFERTVDLEKAQLELSLSLEKEKELSELKSRFVSTASHQFRTPLSVIQASMAILDIQKSELKGDFKASFDQVYERVKGQIRRMTNLMDEVLILSKIDSGNIKPKFQWVDLVGLCEEIVTNYNEIQEDGRKIGFDVKGNSEDVYLDPKLMEHALSNLVSNALKYSRGAKDPSLTLVYENENIEILIKDYGIGIPKKDLKHLFEPFYRASNSGDYNGTGLGSTIAKDYIEMNGGHLSVSSQENVGSVFKISLIKSNIYATIARN